MSDSLSLQTISGRPAYNIIYNKSIIDTPYGQLVIIDA